MKITTKKGKNHPLEKIFFPVKKVEATEYFPDMEFDNPISHFIVATTEEGNERVINTCSPNYELFTNREIFEPIYQAVTSKYDAEVSCCNYGYNRVKVEFIIKDKMVKFDKGELFGKIKIYNSYDSSVRYHAFMELHRVICSNGLSLPVGNPEDYTKFLLHTPGSRQEVEAVLGIAENFLDSIKDIVGGYKPLSEAKRTKDEAIQIMEEIRESIEFPKAALEVAMSRLDTEITQIKAPINDFLVYNCLNYGLYNAELALRDHKKQKLDRKVLDYLLP